MAQRMGQMGQVELGKKLCSEDPGKLRQIVINLNLDFHKSGSSTSAVYQCSSLICCILLTVDMHWYVHMPILNTKSPPGGPHKGGWVSTNKCSVIHQELSLSCDIWGVTYNQAIRESFKNPNLDDEKFVHGSRVPDLCFYFLVDPNQFGIAVGTLNHSNTWICQIQMYQQPSIL